MNEEYKQWKKILANKWVLWAEVILGTVVIIVLGDFIINFIVACGVFFKVRPGEGLQQIFTSASNLVNYVKENWVSMLYPRFTVVGMGSLLLILALVYIFRWRKIYNKRVAYKDINKGTEGTSRWTTEKELNKQYTLVSLDKDKEYEGRAGVPVAFHPDRDKVWIDTTNTNVEVQGATQSGKTQTITYPTLDLNIRAKIPDSMLLPDIKGDLIRRTYFHPLARQKFHIRAFNLIEPKNSLRYNPLYEVQQAYMNKEFGKAQKRVQSLSYIFYNNPEAKEPVWDEGAMSIFEALSLWLAELGYEYNMPRWANMTAFIDIIDYLASDKDKNGRTTLDYYFLTLPTSSPIRRAYSIALKAEKKQTSSFYMMVASKLKYFFSEDIKYLTSGHDIDFVDLAYPKDGKPTLLFLIFPYSDFSNAKILKMFLSQLYQKLAEVTTLGEGEFDVRLRSWLEEEQNLPDVEGMDRYNNAGLQSGMLFGHIIQSKAGHQGVYGETKSKSILGAAGNTYYIKADDFDEAKDFSEKLGPATVITTQRSGDPLDSDKSYTEMEKDRNLLKADELTRLMQGEWVLNRTKYTKDLKGKPIRPYPIKAFYKEKKDASGKIIGYEDYMNAKFAYEYLFSEAGGDFDTKGKKLSELELRENLETDPKTGQPLDRVVKDEDLIVPHDLLDLIIGEAMVRQELRNFYGTPEEKEDLLFQLESFTAQIQEYKDKFNEKYKTNDEQEQSHNKEQPETKWDVQNHSGTDPMDSDIHSHSSADDASCANDNAISSVSTHNAHISDDTTSQHPVGHSSRTVDEREESSQSVTTINEKRAEAKKERENLILMEILKNVEELKDDSALSVSDIFGETYPEFLKLVEEMFGAQHSRYIEDPELSVAKFKKWLESAKKSQRGRAFLLKYKELKNKGVIIERS